MIGYSDLWAWGESSRSGSNRCRQEAIEQDTLHQAHSLVLSSQDVGHARINSMDFCRTDDLLVTGADDDSIRVYNTANGTALDTLFSRKYGVQSICFTHSPECVIYASRKVRRGPGPPAVPWGCYPCALPNGTCCRGLRLCELAFEAVM